jgi:hypothetical protein
MPVKSKAQLAFLAINHPAVLEKWKKEGASLSVKGKPERVSAQRTGKPKKKHKLSWMG